MNNNKGETMANKIFKTLMLGALAGGILLTAGIEPATREFDNLIRYEVHQSQIWLIFFVKS